MSRVIRPPAVAEAAGHRAAILEASAGTGKTFTIEHLVIELLLGGRRYDPLRALTIDQIVVVTFTEKATAEMRLRIRTRIAEIARAPDSDHPDGWVIDRAARTALDQAVVNFSLASISTIHGFCQRTLAEFALLTGAWLAPEVVDSKQTLRRVARECLRTRWLADPDTTTALMAWIHTGVPIEKIVGIVLDAVAAGWGSGASLTLDQLISVHRAALNSASFDRLTQSVVDTIPKDADPDALRAAIGQLRERLCDASTQDIARQLPSLAAAAALVGHAYLTKAGALRKKIRDPEVEAPAAALASLAVLNIERISLIERMIGDVSAALADVRRRERVTDYDHMVRGLAAALRGTGGAQLAAALRDRYRAALVDEFQDTDAAQWTIFDTVFLQGEHTRLYVIGDPKQAIYRFRQADVQVYLEATRRMEADYDAARIRLSQNFRSTANMIDAYNLILDQHASEPILSGAIDYQNPVAPGRPEWRDHTALVDAAGAAVPPVGLVELNLQQLGNRGRLRAAYLKAMVDDVERVVRSPRHRLWVCDPAEPSRRRPVTARGIFILVRSHAEARLVASKLRERQLTVRYKGSETLLDSPDLVALADVVDCLAHPGDRGLRQRALFSVFFAVPLDEVPRHLASPSAPGILLDGLAELASRGRWARLATRLLHDSGVCERLAAAQELDRIAQIEQLLDLLVTQTAARVMTPSEVVVMLRAWSAKLQSPGGRLPDGRSVDERDAISVMTMHTSKGLEADVVYLFGGLTKGSASNKPSIRSGMVDGTRWLGIDDLASTPALDDAAKAEDAAEYRRLIYVALTRARARIVMPCFDTGAELRGKGGRRAAHASEFDFVWKRVFDLRSAPGFAATATEPADAEPATPSAQLCAPRPFDDETTRTQLLRIARTVSYSTLKQVRGVTLDLSALAEEIERNLEQGGDSDDPVVHSATEPQPLLAPWMPRGTRPGRLVHGVLEHIDLQRARGLGPAEVAADPDLQQLVRSQLTLHGLGVELAESMARVCANSVLVPLPIPGTPTLSTCAAVARELELFFPVGAPGRPSVWVKGFADVLLEHDGRYAMLDWKTDAIGTRQPGLLREKVDEHYGAQIALYLLALCRQVGVADETDYDERIAGAIYVFVRALDDGPDPGAAVCVRPSYAQLMDFESQLQRRFSAEMPAEDA